jgi:hypothetical protein
MATSRFFPLASRAKIFRKKIICSFFCTFFFFLPSYKNSPNKILLESLMQKYIGDFLKIQHLQTFNFNTTTTWTIFL